MCICCVLMPSLCPVASLFPKTLGIRRRLEQTTAGSRHCVRLARPKLLGWCFGCSGVCVLRRGDGSSLTPPLLIRLANGGDCGEAFCKGRRLFVIKDSN